MNALIVERSALVDNDITGTEATAGQLGGAAIRTTQGRLDIADALVARNNVTTSSNTVIGGAIRTLAGDLSIRNSTLVDNALLTGMENSAGGAIGMFRPGEATASDGTAKISHSTFAQNAVTGAATDLYADDNASVEVHGSVLEGDCASSASNSPISSSSSYNVLGSTTCNASSSNFTGTPGALGLDAALQQNGGPTEMLRLNPGSPAIDFVPVSDCEDTWSPLDADQRGVPPPAAAACDGRPIELRSAAGAIVNLVGSASGDAIAGTPAGDGALGLGGNDVLKGFAGNDGLCGGTGRDKLVGGPDRDVCDGGKGRDSAGGAAKMKRKIP